MNYGKKMMMVLVAAVLLLLLVYTCTFTVDGTRDLCVVTTFDSISRVIDGADDPGLKFKWLYPVQRLYRYDFREQVLETSLDQLTIAEEYNITAKVFCTWKIEDVEKFHRSKESGESAEEIIEGIRSQLTSDMKSVMGRRSMTELVNNDPGRMKIEEIEGRIRTRLDASVREDYGIRVTSLGIHSLALPESISKSVIDAMIEARKDEAARYRSEGAAMATAIKSRAESAKKKIMELARARAAEIRSRGEEEAAKYYEKFKADPEFAVFLRSLETLRNSLKDRVVFVLDSNVLPVLKRLWDVDAEGSAPSAGRSKPAGSSRK